MASNLTQTRPVWDCQSGLPSCLGHRGGPVTGSGLIARQSWLAVPSTCRVWVIVMASARDPPRRESSGHGGHGHPKDGRKLVSFPGESTVRMRGCMHGDIVFVHGKLKYLSAMPRWRQCASVVCHVLRTRTHVYSVRGPLLDQLQQHEVRPTKLGVHS